MPRRHFVADLERLSQPGALGCCIAGLRRGDDDGSFVFTFKAGQPGVEGVEVAGTVPELSDYPSEHLMFIYTTSHDAPAYASNALGGLDLTALDLEKAIKRISDTLQKALAEENEEEDFEDFGDFEDDSDQGSVGGWSDDDLHLGHDSDSQMVDDLSPETPETIAKRKRLWRDLRHDLRQAKHAGFKVGVLGDYKGGMNFFISLGIRVAKLGISEEAITAWKLDRAKYFIVLTHYSNYYQNMIRLSGDVGGYHVRQGVDLCVGTATRYKPTFQEAITAFSRVSAAHESKIRARVVEEGGSTQSEGSEKKKRDGDFEGIFISGPLNQLLNTALVPLLKYRLQYGFGWDGAELYYNSNQGKESGGVESIPDQYYEIHPSKHALAPVVQADALSGPSLGPFTVSFPLLAMQFALRHLVRCTEFCLVCHTKVSTDFEALKPYVCSNPLCLYQYMSLGFGPSIEYEIVSQPSVVDLLVSFCYTSARAGKLADFPVGMDLRVASSMAVTYKGDYHRFKGEFQFDESMNEKPPLKEGDWILITVPGSCTEEWHARVTETRYWPIVKVAQPVYSNITGSGPAVTTIPQTSQTGKNTPDDASLVTIMSPIPGDTDVREVEFKIYNENFDGLGEEEKRKCIINLLSTLPPITEMKTWLQKNTSVGDEASLRKWRNRISPSALGVLRWIIASNRSCIVPLDDSDQNASSDFLPVQGMGAEWRQFRFAMGAPDKEQRFVNSVREAQQRLNLKHPSLFAFHGSPIANWHSIIREGLHFKQTLHGRAFGHGCYHSLDLSTSMGYSSQYVQGFGNSNSAASLMWPQSELRISSAMSLNEIVNAPAEFVSATPHLVVAQLDWIQTRYLFVQVQKTEQSGGMVPKKAIVLEGSMIHPQDPNYTPRNSGTKLVIPATPATRKRLALVAADEDVEMTDAPKYTTSPSSPKKRKMEKLSGKKKSSFKGIVNLFGGGFSHSSVILDDSDNPDWDGTSVATDTEDLLALLSEDEIESVVVVTSRKDKGKAVAPKMPPRPDTFIPGSLDTSNIEFLAPPSYASSMASKRLNSDLKSLIKLQNSQPIDELGFYINPDHVENVYQWIVEIHSFPESLPLVADMRSKTPPLRSIVLEIRFGPQYPMSPPFVRVVKPRFLGFYQGGGGNVTLGGAMCMELLTNSGWSAVSTVESVLMQVRMALMDEERPARLEKGPVTAYGVAEAVDAFKRACRNHGWKVPEGMDTFLR